MHIQIQPSNQKMHPNHWIVIQDLGTLRALLTMWFLPPLFLPTLLLTKDGLIVKFYPTKASTGKASKDRAKSIEDHEASSEKTMEI